MGWGAWGGGLLCKGRPEDEEWRGLATGCRDAWRGLECGLEWDVIACELHWIGVQVTRGGPSNTCEEYGCVYSVVRRLFVRLLGV